MIRIGILTMIGGVLLIALPVPYMSNVSSSGKNDVSLVAKPADNSAEFTINSLSQTKVQVYFDTYKDCLLYTSKGISLDRMKAVKQKINA